MGKSLYTAEAHVVGGRINGHGRTSDGALEVDLRIPSELGVTVRQDGSRQVTYHGHPLYFYARDGDKSDAYGQGVKSFGAGWYVLAPSGKKIDTS